MPEPPNELPETRDELRLAEVAEDYSRQLEQGLDPDPEVCLADHPELAADLAECFQGLAALAELRASVLPAEEPPLALPRMRGDYELLREIGRGGMGIVYEARQISLGRTVALKMLSATQLHLPSGRRRFQVEVQASARLRHPGIVPVYEAGELDGQPYFTMEYVAGPCLAEHLTQGPLPLRQAVDLVRQVAEAIAHAHEQSIVHRDLKPSNILLDGQQRPRVTDFGLAKSLEDGTPLTLSGEILGTPSYMAPEQAAGQASRIGPRSDVYALGAILYELLTGRPPFLGASFAETLEQVRHQDPVPPEKLNYRIPFELSTICLTCLHKDPEHRYASAGALAADLHAFLEGRPIQARPDTLLLRLARAVRQEPYPEVLQRRRMVGSSKAWLALLVCVLVTVVQLELAWPWGYGLLIVGGFLLVFWEAPRRQDTLVERQVASVWQAFLVGSLVTALLNLLMEPERPLYFSPIIAVLAGLANFVVADLLSGWFYVGASACFVAAVAMVYVRPYEFLVLGFVLFLTLIVPSLKYRERRSAGMTHSSRRSPDDH
jgi:serine/threonine-protein kinase